MSRSLDRLYECLLFTYPRDHRAAHGEELVATAVELARPGQRLPSFREAVGFIVGGLRTRSQLAHARPGAMTWADGVRLGAAMTLAGALAGQAGLLRLAPTLAGCALLVAMLGVTIALLRAPRRRWLPVVALGLGLVLAQAGRALLVSALGDGAFSVVFVTTAIPHATPAGLAFVVNPLLYSLALAAPLLLAAVALAWQPRAGRGRTVWPWWFVGLVIVLPALPALDGTLLTGSVLGMGLVPLFQLWPALLLVAAIVTDETRLAAGVAVWGFGSLLTSWWYLVPAAPDGIVGVVNQGTISAVVLVAALAVTAVTHSRLARI